MPTGCASRDGSGSTSARCCTKSGLCLSKIVCVYRAVAVCIEQTEDVIYLLNANARIAVRQAPQQLGRSDVAIGNIKEKTGGSGRGRSGNQCAPNVECVNERLAS